MKKRIAAYVAVVALLVVAIFAVAAYSDQPAGNTTVKTTCTKYTDANKDGVCDMAAQCHANGGKCAGDCTNCPHMKDGKCDPAKCGGQCKPANCGQTMNGGKCDPAKCGHNQGGCKSQCSGRCGGHK